MGLRFSKGKQKKPSQRQEERQKQEQDDREFIAFVEDNPDLFVLLDKLREGSARYSKRYSGESDCNLVPILPPSTTVDFNRESGTYKNAIIQLCRKGTWY